MRFDAGQYMKTSQQMKLAPRMIQSMEILQMPLAALQERIEQELESNVALELVGPETSDDAVEAARAEQLREDTAGERELVVGDDSPTGAEGFERLGTMETNYSEAFDNEYSSTYQQPRRADGERDGKMDAMANIVARQESLGEQLLHQWHLSDVPEDMVDVGEQIIGYIEDDGLLGADLQTVINNAPPEFAQHLNMELMEKALDLVQKLLDPPGVGARDRRECLLLQIGRFERDDGRREDLPEPEAWADVRTLIVEHYEDLIQNRLPRIAQLTEWPMTRIKDAMGLMKKLTLNPGLELVTVSAPPIVPDVIIEYEDETGDLTARLSDELIPSLRISDSYAGMAKDRKVDKEAREFVSDNVRRASWLIDAIGQRKHTLLRVVRVILMHQRDFFDLGAQHLKPLPMIDVADQLGVHVATISRAVAEKWAFTPRGLMPLRRFFSGGTETEDGQDMSWEAVKATLKGIIDEEDKSRPLSDEAVARAMKERGIEIARRTVVKYRQQLNIPPARHRRVYE